MNTELLSDRPKIRILLYADNPNGITLGAEPDLDLSKMREQLLAHAPVFAGVDVELRARDSTSANNLSLDLLSNYDEVWFFGLDRISTPVNVLTIPEIEVLRKWMSVDPEQRLVGGGVLMTGDHAEPGGAPSSVNNSCPDGAANAEFLGIGRPLGRCVPRAGLLRKWEGDPTSDKNHSFNTQTPVAGIDIDSLRLQLDRRPQELILRRFNSKGHYSPDGTPHPLFFFRNGQTITAFPDHAHEGAVIIPTTFEEPEWPHGKHVQPIPDVVAFGTDKRNCRLLNILAAYNGDSADVGRVVADSTWHHYINTNLFGLLVSQQAGSPGDQIGQYYANLAVWLAPRSKRREMAHLMFWQLINDASVRQELGSNLIDLGRAAYSVLIRSGSSLCEVHELIHAAIPDDLSQRFDNFFLPEHGFALSPFPSKELILGCVLKAYSAEITRLLSAGIQAQQSNLVEITPSAIRSAFTEQLKKITEVSDDAKRNLNLT